MTTEPPRIPADLDLLEALCAFPHFEKIISTLAKKPP